MFESSTARRKGVVQAPYSAETPSQEDKRPAAVTIRTNFSQAVPRVDYESSNLCWLDKSWPWKAGRICQVWLIMRRQRTITHSSRCGSVGHSPRPHLPNRPGWNLGSLGSLAIFPETHTPTRAWSARSPAPFPFWMDLRFAQAPCPWLTPREENFFLVLFTVSIDFPFYQELLSVGMATRRSPTSLSPSPSLSVR